MEFNGTFFAAILSFLVFVFVMNKILYEPVRKIVNERNNFIDSNYKIANDNNAKAGELSADRDNRIAGAKEDAKGKYNEILAGYKAQKVDIVKEAQNKSHEDLESAYAELDNVSNETKENLKWKMTDLANDIIEKVLGYRSEVQGFNNDKINEIFYH